MRRAAGDLRHAVRSRKVACSSIMGRMRFKRLHSALSRARWTAPLLACVCALAACGCGRPANVAPDGTSTEAACYTDAAFSELLGESYPEIASALAADGPSAVPIPGLTQAVTLPYAEEGSSAGDGPVTCAHMIPQGLAVSPDRLYVSAYCEKLEHQSVIWMLDKQSGAYLKTLALPDIPHVGGLAYAPESDGLWVTTNQGQPDGTAQISLIANDDLERYDLQAERAPIAYAYQADLPELPAASSMFYCAQPEPSLLVGHFEQYGNSEVARYVLSADGTSVLPHSKLDSTGSVNELYSYGGMQKAQGLCVDDGHAFASLSWGARDSNLIVMRTDSPGNWADFDDEHLVRRIECPAYMEQIVCDGDDLYLLFEGGASKYRKRDVTMHADRIVKLSLSKLLGDEA